MAVTRLEINSRRPYAEGQSFGAVWPYQLLTGTAHFAVDPNHSANTSITDIELAPRNDDGLVIFSADFRLLQPLDPRRGNRRLLLDVPNRGRELLLKAMNSAPDSPPGVPPHPGDGFLMRQGYTVVWCGWQHDVPDVPGVMRVQVPDAQTPDGGPISGKIAVTFQPVAPSQVQFLSDRNHRSYPADNLEDWESVLTVQEHEDAPEQVIPREQWSFARLDGGRVVPDRRHVYLASGFIPGKVYQAIYSTTGAPVAGLGLLATRNIASFLRYGTTEEGNPCAGVVEHAYSFGRSQSGRFLRLFLYLGLNQDEEDRCVFDGLIPHVGGGKRGEFNRRFAQPSSQASRSNNSLFPFSDRDQIDPLTGRTDGLLSALAARGKLPKVMLTNTSSEYWGGHGALMHTELTGSRDLEPFESVRIYLFAGTQHGSGVWPLNDLDTANGYRGQRLFNCIDYNPLLRAALVNLDRWVTHDEPPPPSRYPMIADATLVPPEQVAATFRAIPGTGFPEPLRRFTRLDFGPNPGVPTKTPPAVGEPYPLLVPAVDQDGNETSGIRLPSVAVPLATYTGWNLRHPDIGGGGQMLASGGSSGGTLLGSTIPFAATLAQRRASGDPRLSIEERYASREAYIELVRQATANLIDQGYLLAEDQERMAEEAAEIFDALQARVKEPQAAND